MGYNMQLELRPYVSFTKSESTALAAVYSALWTCQSKGPSRENKYATHLQGWSHKGSAGIHDIRATARAIRYELRAWEDYWADRKATWKLHPDYKTYVGFRDTQPEHYEAVVKTLRRALRILEKALILMEEAAETNKAIKV
jgi:hypothetical protein